MFSQICFPTVKMDPEDESVQLELLQDYNSPVGRVQILYRLLLDSLRSKDIRSLSSLLEQTRREQPGGFDINYPYPKHSDETCLDIATKSGLPEFVAVLLEHGARVNGINKAHNRAPIHFATENGHLEVLRVLLEEPTINPNLEAGQQTALHMAVKQNDIGCAELLLDKGASPNVPNSKGLTALHIAAMRSKKEMVQLILGRSRHGLDVDNYRDYNDQTTRDVLRTKLPDVALPVVIKRGPNIHDLKYYLNANDEANFLKCFNLVEEDAVGFGEDLVEMAVQRNFRQALRVLLERIRGTDCSLRKAAKMSIQLGQPDVLREILSADYAAGRNLILDAAVELGIPGKRGADGMAGRLECLKVILDRDDADVRCTDSKGNTPLHYAARADSREAVTLLLEKGSYIGHMNNFGVPPIADITASTLSKYLDDCLRAKRERTNDYTIEFNYHCLKPHGTQHRGEIRPENSTAAEAREMAVFHYIAENKALKHLLKHPLLSSFLYLKWHRIRHLLYINFVFYVLFYVLLNAYIMYVMHDGTNGTTGRIGTNASNTTEGREDERVRSSSSLGYILRFFTAVALLFLALRETMQMLSSPWHYVCKFDNWMEVTLIILGAAVLLGAGAPVAAIAILLSAWELVLLIGQHPRMSTGIEMFKTVSLNFMRFLFLYAFLILAFALAFFALFRNGDGENFPDPGHSLFKTIIMLTGEFDADDIPFVAHPILSRCVFVLFVFLIAIVLFNLLNGLAVSDTAEILGKAELVGLISRTRLVAYVENVAVRAPHLHGGPCFSHDSILRAKCKPLAFLARRVLLFPNYLRSGTLTVKPDDHFEAHGNNSSPRKSKFDNIDNTEDKVIPTFKMDPGIIKDVKEILSRRGRESDTDRMLAELEKMRHRLAIMEVALTCVKRAVENNNLNVTPEE